MSSNKKHKFSVIILVLIAIGTLFQIHTAKASSIKFKGTSLELTLKEAISLGIKQARIWNKQAALYQLTSVDETMGGTRGETGRRYNWNMHFFVPGKKEDLSVFISEGKVVWIHEGKGFNPDKPIKISDIVYDSPDLVKIAKKTYHLKKSVDWATGFQFILNSVNGKPIVSVLGMDQNFLWTGVNLDPKTGEIIEANHKVPHGGGLITERIGTHTPSLSKKGMAVMGVTSQHSNMVIWGDQKPRAFNFAVHPFIERSSNRGQSWIPIDFNQFIIHAWFDSHDHLYAITESGVWRYVASSNKMARLLALNSKGERVDQVDQFKIDISTNHNIAFLSNRIIYTSIDNGIHWRQTTQPKPGHLIQVSNEGTVLFLTYEGNILLKNGNNWRNMPIPDKVGHPYNIKLINHTLFVLTNRTLWVHSLKSSSWENVPLDAYRSGLFKKGNKLYLVSENNTAYQITFEKAANKWKAEKVFQEKEGMISDIETNSTHLFIATVPNYYWEGF